MQQEDFKWYVEHIKELYKQYGKKFLAIKNKKVIGVYSTFDEGVNETMKKEKLGTFIIQKCDRNKMAYTCTVLPNITNL